jgi:hypothetical protein
MADATLTARLAALKAALGSGILTVRDGDQSVTYQSAADISRAIAFTQAEIDAAEPVKRKRMVRIELRAGR